MTRQGSEKEIIRVLRETVAIACVGCGFCCAAVPCAYGKYTHPRAEGLKCPALMWNGERYVCEIMLREGGMGDFYKMQLGVGRGCRSFLNPWRKEVRERTEEEIQSVRS